jgi:hypothetical protein
MKIQTARDLISKGYHIKEVMEICGINRALYYQLKRESKRIKTYYGCVVCGSEKAAFIFCKKHYYTYFYSDIQKKRAKI